MEETTANNTTTEQPPVEALVCPRCGCPESRVIETRKRTRAANPQPLPGVRRTRQCTFCQKQYRTRETPEVNQ